MKSICKKFSGMGVIFRDESNQSSFTIIGYSDATVTAPRSSSNHAVKDLISLCHAPQVVHVPGHVRVHDQLGGRVLVHVLRQQLPRSGPADGWTSGLTSSEIDRRRANSKH